MESMNRSAVETDFARQGPIEERNAEKWSRVLPSSLGPRAADDPSHRAEVTAHPCSEEVRVETNW